MSRELNGISVILKLLATVSSFIEDGDGEQVGDSGEQGFQVSVTITNGTSANQADRAFAFKGRALASAATENLDLYDLGTLDIYGKGAGRGVDGHLITLAEIVCLLIRNDAASTGTLLVGGESSGATWNSPFNASDSAKLSLPPSGVAMLFLPADPAFAVADSTNHLLKLEASAGDLTYSLALLGRSA